MIFVRSLVKLDRLWPFFIFATLLWSCSAPPVRISGRTMGTTYTVTVPAGEVNQADLQRSIDSLLAEVNAVFSVWDQDSEVSRFNRWVSPEPFPVSDPFQFLLERSLDWSRRTGGAFDITVFPLVKIWGFGPGASPGEGGPPSSEEVEARHHRVGYTKLALVGDEVRKLDPRLELDTGAIAKGYAVDLMWEYLTARGLEDFLVEIGGELRSRGLSPRGGPWKVGVEQPEDLARPGESIDTILELRDRALATSGDYRNFFTYQGTRYTHIIDPRSGYPARSGVASVTVLGPRCVDADALATGLMVLDPEAGLELVESLEDFEAYWILRWAPEEFHTLQSSGMLLVTG